MGSSNEKKVFSKDRHQGGSWLELYAYDRRTSAYIVGNFNNWQIDLERFQLGQLGPGHFSVPFSEAQLQHFHSV
ncbi:MAG: hypothetical protein IPL49_17835 [Saprospirales bacterium]|nr:hypothetical protein [Saprospirales bacterium]